MISAQTAALVAGGMRAPASKPPAPVTVRILRGVMLAGQRVEPGADIDVPPALAAELVSAGKAAHATRAAPAATPPAAKKPAKENTSAQQ